MRKAIFILVAVFLVGMANAQPRTEVKNGAGATVYTAGTPPSTTNEVIQAAATFGVMQTKIDTSAAVLVPGVGDVTLWIHTADSASIVPTVQYRPNSTASWVAMTVAAGDTLITTVTTGATKGYVLRGGTTNRIPGAARLRFLVKNTTTAGNGSAYGVGTVQERQ